MFIASKLRQRVAKLEIRFRYGNYAIITLEYTYKVALQIKLRA